MKEPTCPALREFTIPGNISIWVPKAPGLMTAFILEEQGDWFEAEIEFVRKHIGEGMAVVDIGANYGIYTLTCARRVGPTGQVWAYEPGSLPRTCLARSLSHNGLGNTRLSPAALSDHGGTARLGIATNAELNRLDASAPNAETVPLTTLDTEARAWDRPVDFLKIDAEGEELHIVEGGGLFFAENDPLAMFEYHQAGEDHEQLHAALGRLEMGIFRYLPSLEALVPLSLAPTRECLLNIFACRPGRAARLARANALVEASQSLPGIDPLADAALVADWFAQRPWQDHFPSARRASAHGPYISALADAIRGEEIGRPLGARLAYKQRAHATLRPLAEQGDSLPRLLSAARLAMDLAEQPRSVDLLLRANELLRAAAGHPEDEIGEPFLPPDRRHDQIPAAGTAAQILALMVDEPLLWRTTYSTYYAGRKALPILLRLAANPLRSPDTDRRLAAARTILPF